MGGLDERSNQIARREPACCSHRLTAQSLMSARAPFCRHRPGRREPGCQVDGLPNLSLPGFLARSSRGILSGVLEEARPALEPNGALDRHRPFRPAVVLALPAGGLVACNEQFRIRLLGGLVGNQGGICSAAKLGFSIPKADFVGAAIAIGLFVDAASSLMAQEPAKNYSR